MPKKQTKRIRVNDAADALGRLVPWLTDTLPMWEGGEAVFSVEKPTRSNAQNRYLWGMVYPAVRDGFHDAGVMEQHLVLGGEKVTLPITVEYLHLWFKHKYLTPEEPGEEPTTTTLSTTQMTRYIESIRNDPEVRRLGIHVPSPRGPHPADYE